MNRVKTLIGSVFNTTQTARENGVPVISFLILAVALFGLGWAMFGLLFTLGFLLLSGAYTAIAVAVAMVIAWWYVMKMEEVWENNNTYLYILAGATAITFVIALFNFGPALLLPEATPSPETRRIFSYFFSHLWLGKNATPTETPTNPLPWATGTWFWWKAFFLYFILTLGYIPVAFWDEVNYAFAKTAEFIKEKTKPDPHHPHPGQPGQPATAPAAGHAPGGGHSFGEQLKLELIVEGFFQFVKYFLEKRRNP